MKDDIDALMEEVHIPFGPGRLSISLGAVPGRRIEARVFAETMGHIVALLEACEKGDRKRAKARIRWEVEAINLNEDGIVFVLVGEDPFAVLGPLADAVANAAGKHLAEEVAL